MVACRVMLDSLHSIVMKPDAEEKRVFDAFRDIAELAAWNLSIEHYYNQTIVKIPHDVWERIVKGYPAWFDFYFLSPTEALQQMTESAHFKEAFKIDSPATDPLAHLKQIADRAKRHAKETVAIAKDLVNYDGPVVFAQDEPISADDIKALALLKALTAETRSRMTYGQGMHALVKAGKTGNDKGYLRAVSIDSAVQWHPSVAERLTREAFNGHAAFAKKLNKVVKDGSSKAIDKDLGQLRYVLGFLHELGLLKQMSDAERYDFFCKQLGLYPDTGKNPKAALCTFIKRWEASLV
jgi:hypothetical protein